jgi:hypothetical protein
VPQSIFGKIKECSNKSILSRKALLLQHRSAFSLYIESGNKLEKVRKFFPESTRFVKRHKNKSLAAVSVLLTELSKSAS